MGKQKILEVKASSLPTVKRGRGTSQGNRLSRITNMRLDCATGRLKPMGWCRGLTNENGQPLLISESPDGREWLMIASGSLLKAVGLDEGRHLTELGQLGGEPRCAVATQRGIIVMTSAGAETVAWDRKENRWILAGPQPEFPPLSIVAQDDSLLSATIGSEPMTGSYPHGAGILTSDDRRSLTDAVLDAYRRLDNQARGQGSYIQPLLAYYRIKDADGNTLYRSAPVVVCGPGGFQATNRLTTSVNSGHRQAVTLSARSWKLAVTAPLELSAYWGEKAAEIEIMATKQLHPVRMKGESEGSLTQDNATTSTLTFTMPGVAHGTSGDMQREATVIAALDRLDEMADVVGRFSNPFKGGIGASGATITIDRIGQGDTDSDWCDTEKKLSKGTAAERGYRDATMNRCLPPHRFTATRCAMSGDTVMWGNPAQIPYDGYPLPMMSAETGSGNWRAYIAVEMADGDERRVWSGGGSGNEPLSLSPLLTYPDGNAKRMTIALSRSDGSVRKETLELTSTPKGNVAYYLHPTLKRWSLSRESDIYLVPAARHNRHEMTGRVISASGGDPLTPTGALAAGPGEIIELTAARRSGSTWEMGRGHFYAFGRWGVAAVGASDSHVVTGASLISTTGLNSPTQVAAGEDGVLALTHNGILKVSGNRCCHITEKIAGGAILGLNQASGEIWVTDREGNTTIINAASGEHVTRKIEHIDGMYTSGEHLILSTPGGLRSAQTETDDTTEVEWSTRLHMDGVDNGGMKPINRPDMIDSVTIDLDSPAADIEVRLRADSGPGAEGSLPLTTLKIKGAVNKPLTAWLRAPRREWVECVIKGTLAAGSSLGGIKLSTITNR